MRMCWNRKAYYICIPTETEYCVKKVFEAVIAVCALAGLIIMTMFVCRDKSLADGAAAFGNLMFYFTIESNLMVFLLYTGKLLPTKKKDSFFENPIVNGSVTLYITVTGIVYFLLLRDVRQGMTLDYNIGNVLLHYITPILALTYRIVFPSREKIRYRTIPLWLIYPLIYLAMTMIRGAIENVYPYPFINVSRIGYPQAFINSGVLFLW